jgi:hypothetical protein
MSLNSLVYNEFMKLDCSGKCQVTYVWLGGDSWDIRSKCRTLDKKPACAADLPDCEFVKTSVFKGMIMTVLLCDYREL